MEFTCIECGGRNAYDETSYKAGSTVEIPCRRCGTFNSITVPGEIQTDSETNEVTEISTPPVYNEPKMEPSYAVEKQSSQQPKQNNIPSDEIIKAQMMLEAERIKLEHRKLDLEQNRANYITPPTVTPSKSKVTAGVLALLLGGFGVHKFYLGKSGMGILYLIFCWTYIPSIIALIEAIIYFTKSDEEWAAEYS